MHTHMAKHRIHCKEEFRDNQAGKAWQGSFPTKCFDEIFWEIIQGCPHDCVPSLAAFYRKHTTSIVNWSASIRSFILLRIMHKREVNIDSAENFIGGHSAVGNLVLLTLGHVAKNPLIAQRIQEEANGICKIAKRKVNLYVMARMPHGMAAIYEVLRYSSSPIVPHMEDVVISIYGVTNK
uniref:Cytochrome P450 n=1 Tax=Glossina austeni TaxID=7395 RepID=A0A1A9VFP9_GLOAU